jgi:predicted dehydrogenase
MRGEGSIDDRPDQDLDMSAPLRVGVVGCGNVAVNFHLPAYRALPDRFELVGLADPTPERLEAGRVAAGLPERLVHQDARHLLARDDIDLVDVCTPQHHRRDLLVAAAATGRHILCEKPLAAVPADAAAAVAAAEQARVTLAVVHNYLFFPEVVAAGQVIASGEIGQVRTVTVNMLGVLDAPGAAAYDPRWRHDPAAAGGGVLMDMLHAVYLAEHLLGAPAERVSAYVDNATDGDPVEGLALCRLEADGRAALVNVGWGLGPGGIQVSGTLGRLTIGYQDGGTCPWAPFERLTVTTGAATRVHPLPPGKELVPLARDALHATLLDVADAIGQGRAPMADGRQALHILEATVAAYGSAALGATVALPLPAGGPLHRAGVVGLEELDVPEWSMVARRGLFGVGRRPPT